MGAPELLPPWRWSDTDLSKQFEREVHPDHVLPGRTLKTIARRQDNDDVLFEILDSPQGYAVVHLTWAQRRLPSRTFPNTRVFRDWNEVMSHVIIPDNANWE